MKAQTFGWRAISSLKKLLLRKYFLIILVQPNIITNFILKL